MIKKVEMDFHGRPLSIEVGRLAKQADGAALVQYGETVVLVTAVAAKELKMDMDFFPLTVDYQEKAFAAGKIPGGFFKREGRPSEKEILTCRIIDRSIRPLFADGLRCETQIIATVLSADKENDPDVIAMLGTSVALHVSDIPFNGPLAGIRIGRIDGRWVMNPTQTQLADSDMDIFMSGSKDAIVMVEGGAQIVPEEEILEALFAGHEAIQPLLQLQEELRQALGKPKRQVPLAELNHAVSKRVEDLALAKLQQALEIPEKLERYKRIAEVKSEVVPLALAEFPDKQKDIKGSFEELKKNVFRGLVIQKERRIDGRGLKDIRPITCEVRSAAAHPRFGDLHPRRDSGLSRDHPGHRFRRAAGRRLDRRAFQKIHAPLQLPAVQRRRSEVSARPGPARDRPWQSRRAGAASGASGRTKVFLTPFASFQKFSNPTVRPRWRACAAVHYR